MSIYCTSADAANTAVKAFLIRVGEYYLKRQYNTGSGEAGRDWQRIKDDIFKGRCAYCGEECTNPQMEHLIMFNRKELGLHHPGNMVPVCEPCNKRRKNTNNDYITWEEQLQRICNEKAQEDKISERCEKILLHIKKEGYPNLSRDEKEVIRVIAESLYSNIQLEAEKSLKLYLQLHEAFVRIGWPSG
ncbi:hypothetical protein ES707_14072 [subsurface metagenome]